MKVRLTVIGTLALVCLPGIAVAAPCLSDGQLHQMLDDQIASSNATIDTSHVPQGVPLCSGLTVSQFIQAAVTQREPPKPPRPLLPDPVREYSSTPVRPPSPAFRSGGEQSADAPAKDPIREMPLAGPAAARRLNGYVLVDSRGWAFNHYDAGSMRNVRVADGSIASGNYVLRGEYTYNGGSNGWVLAKIAGGKLDCIQFWDAMIGCRALRTPEQGQMMRGALISAVTDGGSSSSSGDHCDAQCQGNRDQQDDIARRNEEQRRADEAPAPEPEPVQPISPFYGVGPN